MDEMTRDLLDRALAFPLGQRLGNDPASWADEDVLAKSDTRMPPGQDDRLSHLLELQREGQLTAADRVELGPLMDSYKQLLLQKAFALKEAVRRGLRGPLEP